MIRFAVNARDAVDAGAMVVAAEGPVTGGSPLDWAWRPTALYVRSKSRIFIAEPSAVAKPGDDVGAPPEVMGGTDPAAAAPDCNVASAEYKLLVKL